MFEHGKKNDFSDNPHFIEHREYGSVNFSIFTNEGKAGAGGNEGEEEQEGNKDPEEGKE